MSKLETFTRWMKQQESSLNLTAALSYLLQLSMQSIVRSVVSSKKSSSASSIKKTKEHTSLTESLLISLLSRAAASLAMLIVAQLMLWSHRNSALSTSLPEMELNHLWLLLQRARICRDQATLGISSISQCLLAKGLTQPTPRKSMCSASMWEHQTIKGNAYRNQSL